MTVVLVTSRLNFRKNEGSKSCTIGTYAGKVLIQVSSRLRTRRILEKINLEAELNSKQSIVSLASSHFGV